MPKFDVEIPRRSNQKYDWESWFARAPFELVKGVDYTVETHAMRTIVYIAAKKHGVRVATFASENGLIVDVIGVRDA